MIIYIIVNVPSTFFYKTVIFDFSTTDRFVRFAIIIMFMWKEVCCMLAAFMGQFGMFLSILFNVLKLILYVLAILALIKYLRTK